MFRQFLIAAALVLTLTACSQAPPEAATAGAPPSIASIVPGETRAGAVFNRQPDGQAALSVIGSGFVKGASISANGRKLDTTYGDNGLLTAIVPADVYAQAGRVAIVVTNPDGSASNSHDFEVKP